MINPKDCITVTDTNVTVNGKRAKSYRGHDIYDRDFLPHMFINLRDWMSQQHQYNGLIAMKVMSSENKGMPIDTIIPEPSSVHGIYFYAQLVFGTEQGTKVTDWGCLGYLSDADMCAEKCARSAFGVGNYDVIILLAHKLFCPEKYEDILSKFYLNRAYTMSKHSMPQPFVADRAH